MKSVSALVTATTLVVLTLPTPAEAFGGAVAFAGVEQGPSVNVTLPNGGMGIINPKEQWGLDGKHPLLSNSKSVFGKQLLVGETGKRLDTFSK